MALVLLCIISFSILVGWNLVYNPAPRSDYEVIWKGAHQIINGDFYERASDKSDYFCFYNFQIPFTYYISFLLRIYDSLITLKIAEIITLVLTNIVLYKIVRLHSEINIAFFGTTLFASFSYIFIGSGIINNQHIGMLLGALSIYILLRKGNYFKYLLSSFVLVIGNLLRPSLMMMFVAVAFVLLLQGLFDRKMLFGLLLFVAVFFVSNELINMMFIGLSLAPYGIKSSDLIFKLLLGLTGSGVTNIPTTDAEHTYLFYDLQKFGFDYSKYREASREYLFSKLLNGQIDFGYIFTKIEAYISGVDNQYLFGDLVFNNSHKGLIECFNFYGVIIYIVTLFGALINTLKQKIIIKNSNYSIPATIFCAYFGIYILFEAQTRYRYEQYFCLFMLSTPIIYSAINRVNIVIVNACKREKKCKKS